MSISKCPFPFKFLPVHVGNTAPDPAARAPGINTTMLFTIILYIVHLEFYKCHSGAAYLLAKSSGFDICYSAVAVRPNLRYC